MHITLDLSIPQSTTFHRMCLRPKADECGGFRRLKLRQGAERDVAVGRILVSEGVEKGWGDLGRFDLNRKLFATVSDQRETMGDVEPRSATSRMG